MITERVLRKWRKEALQFKEDIKDMPEAVPTIELCNRILRMTQELLDNYLLRNYSRYQRKK